MPCAVCRAAPVKQNYVEFGYNSFRIFVYTKNIVLEFISLHRTCRRNVEKFVHSHFVVITNTQREREGEREFVAGKKYRRKGDKI